MRRAVFVLAVVAFGWAFAAGPATPPALAPTTSEIASLRTVGAPAISADGRFVAYAVTTPRFDPGAPPKGDDDHDGGWSKGSRIFVVPASGGTPRPMTAEDGDASAPAFSPDGRTLGFLRKADGKTRLYVMPLDGGEAREVDTGRLEPAAFAYSRDGARIAFLADELPTDDEKRARFLNGGATRWAREDAFSRLWVVPAAGGSPVRAFAGGENVLAFEWSPDGKRFALVLSPSADPYDAANLRMPAVAPADGSGTARVLDAQPANVDGMTWSPDGRFVAWLEGVGTLSLLNHLVVAEVDGSGRWNAAAKLDPTLAGFAWRGDSRTLVACLAEKTRSRLVELTYDGSGARDLPLAAAPDEPVRVVAAGFAADRAGAHVVFTSSTYLQPPNPTVYDLATRRLRVLADVNPQAASWPHGTLSVVRWKSPEGPTIEGVLLSSPAAKPGAAPPLMVMPHGGPDSVTSEGFSWWATYFAAQGYSVFRPNYRGSTGYGVEFYAANRGRLGPIEFMDIESGVDTLIAAKKADPNRLFYGGWSWGGYLTAWTIGHTSRYKAAVAGAAVVDTVYQYVTSDINHGVAAAWEFKGNPWKQIENFDRSNPMRSLGKVTTPTLVLHGEADTRVPFANGRMLYRALSDIGCETEFWAYPREPHGFVEKAHVVHMLDQWTAWYRKHDPGVSGNPGSRP